MSRRGGLTMRIYTVTFAAKALAVIERMDDRGRIDSWVVFPDG